MSNQPTFDPLNATDEEERDMIRGYLDGRANKPPPHITSMAYDHGRRNGVNDRLRRVDEEQRHLAKRFFKEGSEVIAMWAAIVAPVAITLAFLAVHVLTKTRDTELK